MSLQILESLSDINNSYITYFVNWNKLIICLTGETTLQQI
jgi:hypothetical protein